MLPLFVFQSCQFGQENLLDFEKRKLAFSQLPKDVQETYSGELKKTDSNDSETVVSKDKEYSIRYAYTGMDDGIWTLITKGNKHHFYIKDKHFVLQANQGDPFVLSKKRFYYSEELNLDEQNLDDATFIEVNLSKELN